VKNYKSCQEGTFKHTHRHTFSQYDHTNHLRTKPEEQSQDHSSFLIVSQHIHMIIIPEIINVSFLPEMCFHLKGVQNSSHSQ